MKSRLVAELFEGWESKSARALTRDLKEIIALTEEDRARCLDSLTGITLAQTNAETRPLVDALASQCSAERTSLERALSAMGFLLRAMLTKDLPANDVDLWPDDLEENGVLDAKSKPVFKGTLELIKQKCMPTVQPVARRRKAAAGVLPGLQGAEFTVEVRPVNENNYRLGTPAKDYEPKFVDTTPIASVRITLDEGTPDAFYFQIDRADADYLIDMLEAAKKEMGAFEAFLHLSKKQSGGTQHA